MHIPPPPPAAHPRPEPQPITHPPHTQRNGIPPNRTRQHGLGWRSPSSNNLANGAAAAASSSSSSSSAATATAAASASASASASYPRAPVGGGTQYVPVTDPERLFAPRYGGGRRGEGGGGGFPLRVFGGNGR